jgi:hypothetical protein
MRVRIVASRRATSRSVGGGAGSNREEWAKAAMVSGGPMQQWTAFQKRRLLRLLDWQRDTVARALASPWIALKREKPGARLFLDI